MAEDNFKKVARDFQGLPPWFQWLSSLVALYIALTAIIFGFPSQYSAVMNLINPPSHSGTADLSDIFKQYDSYEKGTDQQTFLLSFVNTQAEGTATFENINKPSQTENSYDVFAWISTGWFSSAYIACEFDNTDASTSNRLKLLSKGNKFNFTGNFTGSTLNLSNAWYISACQFKD